MAGSALALKIEDRDAPEDAGAGAMRLTDLLAATAARHPNRQAFADQPGRDAWSGRPPLRWTYGLAETMVGRLAGFLSRLGFPPGSPIGICLPNGTEACLSLLAAERAGLVPCLLPLAWDENELVAGLEAANVQGLITQGTLGEERPAALFCRLAARHYGLRFVCAFGPSVPDGVIDLDRVLVDGERLSGRGEAAFPAEPLGAVTFPRRDPSRPVHRPTHAAVAAGIALLSKARIGGGERTLSLLAPDDHRGLTTGLVASLVAGATLECHGLFDAGALLSALDMAVPTHLVAPGWMEDALAAGGLSAGLRSTVLVHEAPTRFRARGALDGAVVDVLAFDELALLAAVRDERGSSRLALSEEGGDGLLQARRDGDGRVLFAGPSAEVQVYHRNTKRPGAIEPGWRGSGFRAEIFAGLLIGVDV